MGRGPGFRRHSLEKLLGQSSEILWQPKVKMLDTAHGVNLKSRKDASPLKYSLAHLAVRLIVIINIAHLCLSYYQPYFQATKSFFRGTDLDWLMISSLTLPLWGALETFWLRRAGRSQRRALLIDWAFIIVWFLTWWAFLLHSIWKYVGNL